MADTILGYEVASKEQQRKTAIIIAIVAPVVIVGALIAFYGVTQWQQKGRELAIATINSVDVKCRYVVQNISKRSRTHDHTGYVSCAEAEQVAEANADTLIGGLTGSVQRRILADVSFATKQGEDIRTTVQLYGDEPFTGGQKIEVLYLEEQPSDAEQFAKNALGFGKKSELAVQEQQIAVQNPVVERKPRPADSLSRSTRFWIGLGFLAIVFAIAFFIIRFIFRAVKNLMTGGDAANEYGAASRLNTVASQNASNPRLHQVRAGNSPQRPVFGKAR